MHLRKAKLMFFYQRYPSSPVLKSYFPDVHFNKYNTAQVPSGYPIKKYFIIINFSSSNGFPTSGYNFKIFFGF